MRIGALIIGDELLSGKREDKHLPFLQRTLAARHATLDWVQYIGDDRELIAAALRESFARGDTVFSFGGIGGTPDDHTRQAAATALERPLRHHPEALRFIEERFGDKAYPLRVRMAEFPEGAQIIPNPVNRIAGFSVDHHYFVPGFPQMAWPMIEWVLDNRCPELARLEPREERAIVVLDAPESELTPLMERVVANYPELRLFSLPTMLPDGGRRIELGVRGPLKRLDDAMRDLREGVEALGFRWTAL